MLTSMSGYFIDFSFVIKEVFCLLALHIATVEHVLFKNPQHNSIFLSAETEQRNNNLFTLH